MIYTYKSIESNTVLNQRICCLFKKNVKTKNHSQLYNLSINDSIFRDITPLLSSFTALIQNMSRKLENNSNKDLISTIIFGLISVASSLAIIFLKVQTKKLEKKIETLHSAVHVALDSNSLNIREALEVLHRKN